MIHRRACRISSLFSRPYLIRIMRAPGYRKLLTREYLCPEEVLYVKKDIGYRR